MAAKGRGDFKRAICMTGFSCTGCGYDLSGTHIGTTCPECGLPVEYSFEKENKRPTELASEVWAYSVLSLGLFWLGPLNLIFVRKCWEAYDEMGEYSLLLQNIAMKRERARIALVVAVIAAGLGIAAGIAYARWVWMLFV